MSSWMSSQCFGQQLFSLEIESNGAPFQKTKDQKFDSTGINLFLKTLIDEKRKEGFLLANLDELNFEKDNAHAKIHMGKKYDYIHLNDTELPKKIKKSLGIKSEASMIAIPIYRLTSILKDLITYHQNNGYPFATVRLDSIHNDEGKFSARIDEDKGPLITFDSLDIGKSNIIKYQFIVSYLDIQYGTPFDQSKVDDISRKIDQLSYLKLNSKPSIDFRLGKGQIKLGIDGKKVNTFDGIVGLLPGTNGSGNRLTGELKLSFDNLFRSGKKVDFEWQKLNNESQFLDASYEHPLLFHSPLNFSFNFNQLKEDSLFSNRSFVVGFNYNLSSTLNFSVSYENKNGNNLTSEVTDVGDFDVNVYSLGFRWRKLDNLRFPKNGFALKATTSIGAKTTTPIANMIVESNRSDQYEITGEVAYYKQLSKRSIFHTKIRGGYLTNDQLFLNDLFRIGGLNTLRGFNEKLFFASEYALINAELRWLVSRESYFLIFGDQVILNYNIENNSFDDKPTGVGFGFKIKTPTGYFNLIYALGRTQDQNFSFNFSKLHFGLTATL